MRILLEEDEEYRTEALIEFEIETIGILESVKREGGFEVESRFSISLEHFRKIARHIEL